MGRIRSYRTKGYGRDIFTQVPRFMSTNSKQAGSYLQVGLMRDGQRHVFRVHKLVLNAFVGPAPADKPHGRHLNGNPQDNRLENLAWGSAKENYEDSVRHGTAYLGVRAPRGEDHPTAKLTDSVVEQMKLDAVAGMSRRDINKKYGYKNASAVLTGNHWGHIRPDLNTRLRENVDVAEAVRLVKSGKILVDVARLLGTTASAVSRAFKRHTGISVRQWRAGVA